MDGHPVMRLGLRTLLDVQEDIRIVGEFGSGGEAPRLVAEGAPDLVVLDLNLIEEPDGVEVCRRTKALPEAPYLLPIYTAYNLAGDVSSSVLPTADSYLYKHRNGEALLDAVWHTAAGEKLDVWAVDASPALSPSPALAFSTLNLGADTALAASEPRNLTPGSDVEARSPNWGPNTAPTITGLRPRTGSTTTELRPLIGTKVTDAQTNLAKRNITLLLDEKRIPRTEFAYDRAKDRLSYTPGSDLSLSNHTVTVVAQDPEGLQKKRSWSFSVVQP